MGILRISSVGVEHHLAIGQCADGLAVFDNVTDEHDGAMAFFHNLTSQSIRPQVISNLTEISTEADLVFVRNNLVSENDNQMFEPGIINCFGRCFSERLGQIDTPNFSA